MSNMITVGQKLYRAPHRYCDKITEYTVTKVGRKNFEVEPEVGGRGKFVIETLQYVVPDYSQHNFQLYISVQAIEDEQLLNELGAKISRYFSGWSKPKLTLDQAREIVKILGI